MTTATAAEWSPAEDPAYRERVIASAGRMDSERGARTARHAYLAMDQGPDSQAAADLQGYESARGMLWSYELHSEQETVQTCTTGVIQRGGAEAARQGAERLAATPGLARLVAIAEAEAGAEYAAALGQYAVPSDADRAFSALGALLSAAFTTGNPVASAAAAYYIAAGSDGECTAPARLLLIVENQP